MLGGIFNKRKKSQDLRSPSLKDVKKFRDTYAKYAELRQVEIPPCLEKSIYKAIAGQKELHIIDLRQEDITDQQVIVLAEAILEIPMVSSLDLRENQITDEGAKALLEVLRLQIILAKTLPSSNFQTKQSLYMPIPEYTRFVANVNLRGNEISASILQEFSHYMDLLRREDKRLEIRAALNRVVRNDGGDIDEEELKSVFKLLHASTPTNKDLQTYMQSSDISQNMVNLENVLLAKCAVSPSKSSACPPWEALVRERHATLGASGMTSTLTSTLFESFDASPSTEHPNFSPSDCGMKIIDCDPTTSSSQFPDVSPLLFCTSRAAPVSPINMITAVKKSPLAPTTSTSIAVQQAVTKISELNRASLSSDEPATYSPPSLLLSQAAATNNTESFDVQSCCDEGGHQAFLQLSVQSTRLTAEHEDIRCIFLEPNLSVSAPPSPHDSDVSISTSVDMSAFSGFVSQLITEGNDKNTKLYHKDNGDVVFVNDDDSDTVSACDIDDDVKVASSSKPNGFGMSSRSGNDDVLGPVNSFQDLKTSKTILHKERKSSIAGFDVTARVDAIAPQFNNFEALQYREIKDGGRAVSFCSNTICALDESEDNTNCVESLIYSVLKDGKERSVTKLTHSEFRNGLTVENFPAVLPFRNLIALLLPKNDLSDLHLFAECRFPFVTVLDLSRNKLIKLTDDGLIAFPRLEVLNLEENQLKTISGLTKTFKLRALGLSNNAIRTLKNIEHLLQLEILNLAHNVIATVHTLRVLSLNKLLVHLNLDGNPVVETDERQKRKNIVYVRNILPALQSMGSISLAHLKANKTAGSNLNSGNSLFDNDLMPEYRTFWVTKVCSTLSIVQDGKTCNLSQKQYYDNGLDSRDEDGKEEQPKLLLNRDQQRENDKLRSRALKSRSRNKAASSPPKVKTSPYCFGPPQVISAEKKKKLTPVDLNVVREQQRRASELSAPKYTPIDKTLLIQQQKQKSRVEFNGALTVGERLQLAKEMTQRRPSATDGFSTRSRSILAKAERSRIRTSITSETGAKDEFIKAEESLPTMSRPPTAQTSSVLNKALLFREKVVPTPQLPRKALTFSEDLYSVDVNKRPVSPKVYESKEAKFLHDLAVSDYLDHAKEEFSTALTALNVLLSMSEKEHEDRTKMAEYRVSLDALDILNEHESHELYKLAQDHSNVELQTQCTDWFTKLGTVKKCVRQLLEKLEFHSPGSRVIRAYCQCIRSNELRGITTAILGAKDISQTAKTEAEKEKTIAEMKYELSVNGKSSSNGEVTNLIKPIQTTTSRKLFGDTSDYAQDVGDPTSAINSEEVPSDDHTFALATEVANLRPLESVDSVFDKNEKAEVLKAGNLIFQSIDYTISDLTKGQSLNTNLVATKDVAIDFQKNHLGDEREDLDMNKWNVSAFDNIGFAEKLSAHGNDNALQAIDNVIKSDECESYGQELAEGVLTSIPAAIMQNEDYDWLASSLDLDVEIGKSDLLQQKMEAVFGDEKNKNKSNKPTDSSDEKEVDTSQEYTYEGEIIEENVAYNENKVVTEKLKTKPELEESIDAEDEESEIFGDWEKGFDSNSNHHFWFNHNTGESTWVPPEGWPYAVDVPFGVEDETGSSENELGGADGDGQVYDDSETESHYYEERPSGRASKQGDSIVNAKTDKEGKFESPYIKESAVEDIETGYVYANEEGIAEVRQQGETTTDDHWNSRIASRENLNYQFFTEKKNSEESPRRSEVSDFEFDDSDLPGL